jgi:hypothetical protein
VTSEINVVAVVGSEHYDYDMPLSDDPLRSAEAAQVRDAVVRYVRSMPYGNASHEAMRRLIVRAVEREIPG